MTCLPLFPFLKGRKIYIYIIPYLQDTQLVYKTYATLYFVFIFDSSENELAMLDLMQGTSESIFLNSWSNCFSRGQGVEAHKRAAAKLTLME